MMFFVELIIYGIVFVVVIVFVEGIYLIVFGKLISLNNKVNCCFEMFEKGGNCE